MLDALVLAKRQYKIINCLDITNHLILKSYHPMTNVDITTQDELSAMFRC